MTSPSPMADAPKPLTLIEWLQERIENTERIARTKFGAERRGWEEDGAYLRKALAEVTVAADDIAELRALTASRAARGETNEAMAKRLGALFVLALQSGDSETREAARVASGELDWAYGYPRFLPALAAAPAPAEAGADADILAREIEALRHDAETAQKEIERLREALKFAEKLALRATERAEYAEDKLALTASTAATDKDGGR